MSMRERVAAFREGLAHWHHKHYATDTMFMLVLLLGAIWSPMLLTNQMWLRVAMWFLAVVAQLCWTFSVGGMLDEAYVHSYAVARMLGRDSNPNRVAVCKRVGRSYLGVATGIADSPAPHSATKLTDITNTLTVVIEPASDDEYLEWLERRAEEKINAN